MMSGEAQEGPAVDADLVLEGGGVKGIALVGAISVLEERGYGFQRIAGTSAGAVVGAFVAAGLPAKALEEVMETFDFRRFRDAGVLSRLGPPGVAASLLLRKGVYRGDRLHRWLDEVLSASGRRTFGDLRRRDDGSALPADRDYRLVVIASDVSGGRLAVLPWDYARYGRTADTQPVADAVRASAGIPYYYRPVRLPDAVESREAWLVDGGLLSNFPVWVFDRDDDQPPRWPTFGIKLSAPPDAMQGRRHRIRGLISFSAAMLSTMTSFYDQIHLDAPSVVARTMFVDTMKVRSTDFDIDRRSRRRLFDNGRRAAERFLDGGDGHPPWDFDAYIERFRRPDPDAPLTP
jgi:NTE family protein